jgi:hypothetical protein
MLDVGAAIRCILGCAITPKEERLDSDANSQYLRLPKK